MSSPYKLAPPDQSRRDLALDPMRSILVQAPAGSGKTTLLAERFLRLLSEVDEPDQVVAITFTNAAAAEMRNRIMENLRDPEPGPLAQPALERSQALGWNLLEIPAQLRIRTIDSFCRELALQQPLLSGLGGGLDIAEQSDELYRRAARRSLEQIDNADPTLSGAIAALLKWRDNNWKDVEDLLVLMLGKRERWMQDFVLACEPNWDALRLDLEKPFAQTVSAALTALDEMLDQSPGAREEILSLARFACAQPNGEQHRELAELAELPTSPFAGNDDLIAARDAYLCLAKLLLTGGAFRKAVDKRHGFPADRKQEKARLLQLIQTLGNIAGFESALAAIQSLPPARYTEDDWQIVQACFILLRHAVGQLQVVFAESGTVDYTEVAQIARRVLKGEDGLPTDAALGVADGIRHLLVDEFQDTSRRQYELLARIIAAWPERDHRTCFAVGDPMQSIYFFREADVELFARVKAVGLEIPQNEPLLFDFFTLSANFRTQPALVDRLNKVFEQIFAADDGSGVNFSKALPDRDDEAGSHPHFNLHLDFVPQTEWGKAANPEIASETEAAHEAQNQKIVRLIRNHWQRVEQARASEGKYRIAVLARARKSLAPIALALREAGIPFRAVELENLKDRPEVLDALGLARALLNPQDRVAWLGVLRAPWCGLALDDLHLLAGNDDSELLSQPMPELLAERLPLLSDAGQRSAGRVLDVWNSMPALRSVQPTASTGTWLEQVWLRLGGAACVDTTARANLDLLWGCIDRLPDGEQDLLGPALDAALNKLTALPNPEAGSDCGVQLMTIHKSKGLEFEVVVVPELQARTRNSKPAMLSWLERGLAQPDSSGEITEFLIAPFQPKGKERGEAKVWVDREIRQRETQEDRRIFYTAATRAREELHLFARPDYKIESNGELILADPKNSLLATAWPALEFEVHKSFEKWKAVAAKANVEMDGLAIAASSESNLLVMPSAVRPAPLCRLPPEYQPASAEFSSPATSDSPVAGMSATRHYSRHEGGMLSRAFGTAVHTLLEELARVRNTHDWSFARAALKLLVPRIAAEARSSGMEQAQSARIAAQALESALSASKDPLGQWILSPHADAESEISWAGVIAGSLSTVRIDRVFRAGTTPGSEGEDIWWIVDYKTAHADNADPATALPELRKIFAPQLETYAAILRNLHGADAPIRAGLYYPRMASLDWWEL